MQIIRAPCQRLNFLKIKVGIIAMQIISIQTGISRNADCFPTGSVPPERNAHIGKIIVKSIMFAPMILPMDKSDCFLAIAVMVVTNSGSEVPTAIIVTPIIASETPNRCAITVPSSTNKSAPITIPAAPRMNFAILIKISLPVAFGPRSSSVMPNDFLPDIMFSATNLNRDCRKMRTAPQPPKSLKRP